MTEDNETDYGRFEELERETITKGIIRKVGSSGSLDFMRNLPFNQAKWVSQIGDRAREQTDLDGLDDDREIAWYCIEQVKLYDNDTAEFEVRYEGRWGLSATPAATA